MFLLRRLRGRSRQRSKAQSLVEFALLLPVLLLLLLVAIDFGRALYAWVVIQNSARVGANFAGLNSDAWELNIATVQDEYETTVLSDFLSANCDVPDPDDIPEPVFTDGPDTAVSGGPTDTNYDVGDTVVVELGCDFHLITPFITAVLGDPVAIAGRSEFRIRAGDIAGLSHPTQIPPAPTPTPTLPPAPTPTPAVPCNLDADFSRNPSGGNIRNGTPVTFTNSSTASGCTIVSYAWTFQLGTPASQTGAGPHTVTFTVPSQQDVTVTLVITSSTGATDNHVMTFRVRP
jgi:hypothetical protein